MTLAETDLSHASLATAGLLFSSIQKREYKPPGPWPRRCRVEVIKADLAKWIFQMLEQLKTDDLRKWGFDLELKKYDGSGASEFSLVLKYPLDCTGIFCETLVTLSREDPALEKAVIAGLQVLNWVRPYFDYDDAIEQYIEWADGWIGNPEEGEESKVVMEKIQWMQSAIPQRYRFLFRNRTKKKPSFPRLPSPPPKRSWRYPWWLWVSEARRITSRWRRRVPYTLHENSYYCDLIDPGYFYPFLWSHCDPITEHVDELMNSEFQSGGEAIQDFCFKNRRELLRVLEDMRVLGEAFDLHMKAANLPLPKKKGVK